MRMTTASSASLRHWGNTPSLLSVCVMDGSEFDARFADQTPEERQILPGLGLFIGSSKQVGRMIADDGLRAEVADRHVVHASSLAADRSVGSQTEQRLHGEASHDEKHVGANEKKLPAQIGCAAGHLGGRGLRFPAGGT